MNQKGFANITLVVIITAIIAFDGYFAFVKKAERNTSDVTFQTEDPNKVGLALYPDLSITSLPAEPVSVKFIVEHRSALNTKSIKVHGIIVGTWLGKNERSRDIGAYFPPNIFLADTTEKNRDVYYDLSVRVNEEEQEINYPVGKIIEIQVVVDGSKESLNALKIY